MAAADLDAANLAAVTFGGLINESVMQQIWDIYTMLTDIEDAFRCMK